MTVYDDELIVGGYFSQAGNKQAFCIARWNGSVWNDLDTGIVDMVEALTVDTINNFLYAGGGFWQAGGNGGPEVYNIARWDGYEWSPVGDSYILRVCVLDLVMYHNNLFAAGCDATGTIADTVLAHWDGKKWHPVTGINSAISALAVFQDSLYIGGAFDYAGTDSIKGVAYSYFPPDNNCDYLEAIIQPRNCIIGTISDTSTVHFYNNIAHADSWSWDFGDGESDTVQKPVHKYTSQGVYDVSVIVSYQGCLDTANTTITVYDEAGIDTPDGNNKKFLGDNIPNPFNNTTSIPYYLPQGSKGLMQITDIKGKLINEYPLEPGNKRLEVMLTGFSNGVYFYSILIDGQVKQTKKMVLAR
jgi:hypothetical protein